MMSVCGAPKSSIVVTSWLAAACLMKIPGLGACGHPGEAYKKKDISSILLKLLTGSLSKEPVFPEWTFVYSRRPTGGYRIADKKRERICGGIK